MPKVSHSSPKTKQTLIAEFPHCRVLVVGDVMYDRFTHGTVERISPEAPIPVLRVKHNHEMLGGAGNAALNIVAAGGKVTLLGVVGDDLIGQQSQSLAKGFLSPESHLIVEANRPTTLKQRFVAGNQQMLRVDTETSVPIQAETEKNLLAAFEKALPFCQAVLISDYAKGVLTDNVLATLISRAKAAKLPVLVDPKRTDFRAYSGATLVKPNKKEISAAVGKAIETDADVISAGQELISLAKLEYLLVTRGKDGLTVLSKKNATHISSVKREIWDVSGAGDTVIALLALGMAAGASVEDAAYVANIGAGIVVGKVGTATASAAELAEAITEAEGGRISAGKNVLSLDQAVEQVSRWRRTGLKIGFTNGVFDLMHPGHISSVEMAKNECDRLIVAVNSDESVRKLKGPTRPIQDEQHRAAVLAAVKGVDLVLIFGDDTPFKLIEAILPDVLIKGGDYDPEETRKDSKHYIVGSDIVRANGGRIAVTPILEGFSTTNLVNTRGIVRSK